MWRGHLITFTEKGQIRVFVVGIDDRDMAVEAAVSGRDGVLNVISLPLKESEFQNYGLVVGQVLELKSSLVARRSDK